MKFDFTSRFSKDKAGWRANESAGGEYDCQNSKEGGRKAVPTTNECLKLVIAEAIQCSLEETASLERQINTALQALDPLLACTHKSRDAPESVQALRTALQNARLAAADLFERQRAALGTVNVAFFGRTGAGKSSLIEALSCGNGSSISNGLSDFTTEVKPTHWHGIQFLDTPGINGWGRSMKREDLEARSRKAVETADVVVLCFDSQSQQASEFEKVASWVKEYGKSVVAVLNNRNSHWRWPEKVPLGSARRRSAQMVRQHAANISTELEKIGIHAAPVVAIAAQRAVYARTGDKFVGPIPEQCTKMRELLGRSILLRQSNLEILEEIFMESLGKYAVDIRLGMLHAQLRTLVERLMSEVRQARAAAQEAAGSLDSAIKSILEIVGYPPEGSARRAALASSDGGPDILTAAEQSRGDTYSMSAEGRAARYTRQRCGSEVGKLREESIKAANRVVSESFDRRVEIHVEEFKRSVFDGQRIEATVRTVLTDAAEHLERELKLSLADAKLDLDFTAHQGAKVDGEAGRNLRYGGLALRISAMLAGAASMLVFIPEPVISKTVAVVLGVVAGLVGLLGQWLTGKAKAQREIAMAQAYADVTRSVHEAYDRIAEQINSNMDEVLQLAGKEALTGPLQNATALWRFTAEAKKTADLLANAVAALPVVGDAQGLMNKAAIYVTARYGGENARLEQVLLGEDWVSDATGLVADTGSSEPHRSRANDASIFERMFSGLRKIGAQFSAQVVSGAGAEWLAKTEVILATDESVAHALAELRTMLTSGKPRYHLLGDYSTGKTSFIKRLLLDSGQPLPPTLEVRADPATDATHCYEWEDAFLIDTPGLQSSNKKHADVAVEAVADASLLICLFQPNLLVGNNSAMEVLLKGDPQRGVAAKLDRTIFVIHRSDELGPDPDFVPDLYVTLCERKRLELQQAFASKDIPVELERIVCMAADPRGLVGNRSDVNSKEYDNFRHWDGFKSFHAAARSLQIKYGDIGLDFSLLDGGLARLGRIEGRLAETAKDLELRLSAFTKQQRIFSEIAAAGGHLDADLSDQARRLVDDYAQSLRARESRTDDELRAKVNALARWWEQPDFVVKAEHWQKSAQEAIEAWWKEARERLSRTLNSRRFKAAIASASTSLDASRYDPDKGRHLKRALDMLSGPLKGASRDVVYGIGKYLGRNFKPWGAVKLAKGLSRVGIVLGAALVVWDAISLYNFFKEEKRSKQREKELDDFLRKSTEEVFQSITQSSDDSIGPLEALRLLKQELEAIGKELAAEGEEIKKCKIQLHERRRLIRSCMNSAWDALGLPHPKYE